MPLQFFVKSAKKLIQKPNAYSVKFDVKYFFSDRPYANSLQICTWEVNAIGVCKIYFQSNPQAHFKFVLFNGNLINKLLYVKFRVAKYAIYFVTQELISPAQILQVT